MTTNLWARARGGRPRRRGFTLVETIAAMTLVAALGTVSSIIIYSAVSSYRDATVKAQLCTEVSTAMDRLTRALWSINRDTSASVVAPSISSVTPSSIAWNGNWTLSLSGTDLMLSESGGTAQPILKNVTSFSVSARDESDAALGGTLSGAATQAIRRLQVQVTVAREGQSETLRTRIFVRCTMAGAAIG